LTIATHPSTRRELTAPVVGRYTRKVPEPTFLIAGSELDYVANHGRVLAALTFSAPTARQVVSAAQSTFRAEELAI